jgi:hypothetical protein
MRKKLRMGMGIGVADACSCDKNRSGCEGRHLLSSAADLWYRLDRSDVKTRWDDVLEFGDAKARLVLSQRR